jgi:hypothetical protein
MVLGSVSETPFLSLPSFPLQSNCSQPLSCHSRKSGNPETPRQNRIPYQKRRPAKAGLLSVGNDKVMQ